MPNDDLPLLIFSDRTLAARDQPRGGGQAISFPGFGRQEQRLAPQFEELSRAIEAGRLAVDAGAPLQNPELVLVLEVIGTVGNFFKAVARIPGLEWLFDAATEGITPDDDFHFEDPAKRNKVLSGCVYLLGTNQEALQQILSLWNRYKADHTARFDIGYAPFKHLFEQLKNIRPWDHTDRVDADMRAFWEDAVEAGDETVRFEVEAWYFSSLQKNELASQEIDRCVRGLGGRVLRRALIGEIAYHGFLVQVPTDGVRAILNGELPQLMLSDRIMFFRPKTQSVCDTPTDMEAGIPGTADGASNLPPVIALLGRVNTTI